MSAFVPEADILVCATSASHTRDVLCATNSANGDDDDCADARERLLGGDDDDDSANAHEQLL